MSRIYTRSGDDGETGLIGGDRASKGDPRVALYGTADELNAHLGLAASLLAAFSGDEPTTDAAAVRLLDEIASIQSRLFDLGALLADPDRCADLVRSGDVIDAFDPVRLEGSIDRLEEELTPLRAFILPGGVPAAAALHVARTVCRRLERDAVAASESIAVPLDAVRWLNRLSDWLFTAARWLQSASGRDDVPWRPDAGDPAGE